jgi:hypothetical protein
LLDEHLELHGYARQSLFLDLRGEGIRFAIELLDHEVEPSPDWLVAPQNRLYLGHVTHEPIDLLRDVGALRDQRKLLLEPFRSGLHVEPLEALAQSVAVPSLSALDLRLDAGKQRRDAGVAPLKHLGDAASFAGARLGQRLQGRRQARLYGLAELLEILRGLFEHAGPAQHLLRRQRVRVGKHAPHLELERTQPLEGPGDDRIGDGAALVRADLERAVDLAALDDGPDELAALRLHGAEIVGQAESKLQKPVVDAANLPNEPEGAYPRLGRRESRHAVRHSIESGSGFSQSERRFAPRTECTTADWGPGRAPETQARRHNDDNDKWGR